MRKLLIVPALSLALLGCSTTQIQTDVEQAIAIFQAGVAAACSLVPTVNSIVQVVAALTGSQTIVGLSQAVIDAVEKDICSASPPPVQFSRLPRFSVTNPPAIIGTTQHGVVVTGWRR
jgi:hypothetical protein